MGIHLHKIKITKVQSLLQYTVYIVLINLLAWVDLDL